MAVPQVTLTGKALTGRAPEIGTAKAAGPQTVSLGRIRPKAMPMALNLAEYLPKETLKAAPDVCDYAAKAMDSIGRMYDNDEWGCCVISGKFHTVGVLSGNDTGTAVLGTDAEVLKQYHAICGPGDPGCVITSVLDVMRTKGLKMSGKAHKIDGYVACDWTRKDLVKAAIWLFGNLTLGINLPDAWTSRDVWDVTNSPIVGGHDVCAVGYDSKGVTISSWGRLYLITWAAFVSRTWLDECYVLLGRDWYNDDELAPSGVDVAQLREDLAKIQSGTVPDIEPPAPPADNLPATLVALDKDGNELGRYTH